MQIDSQKMPKVVIKWDNLAIFMILLCLSITLTSELEKQQWLSEELGASI